MKIGITQATFNISGNWPLAIEALNNFETLINLEYFLNIIGGTDFGKQDLQLSLPINNSISISNAGPA